MNESTEEEKCEMLEYLCKKNIKDKRFIEKVEHLIIENNLSSAHLEFMKTAIINAYKKFEITGKPLQAPHFIRLAAEAKGFRIIAEYLDHTN